MAKCDFCGKGVTFGIKVSHSHRRSNRAWKFCQAAPHTHIFLSSVCVYESEHDNFIFLKTLHSQLMTRF